jgi:hypothetical protein
MEERTDMEIALPALFQEIDSRSYGDTKIVMARATIKKDAPDPL